MTLQKLPFDLCICKVNSLADVNLNAGFFFIGKTDEEISLVCEDKDAPAPAAECDRGWKGFRVKGILDFSLVGILARLSVLLSENGISIFAVSTYNTDYILVKEENFSRAAEILAGAGYTVI